MVSHRVGTQWVGLSTVTPIDPIDHGSRRAKLCYQMSDHARSDDAAPFRGRRDEPGLDRWPDGLGNHAEALAKVKMALCHKRIDLRSNVHFNLELMTC